MRGRVKNSKIRDYKRTMKIILAYLLVNFLVNSILIVIHFDISSFGNVIFSVISSILPLVGIIETNLHYDKCLRFLQDASMMKGNNGHYQLMSVRIYIKVLFIVIVIVVQIIFMMVRCLIIHFEGCMM
jgi:hypothetical protein